MKKNTPDKRKRVTYAEMLLALNESNALMEEVREMMEDLENKLRLRSVVVQETPMDVTNAAEIMLIIKLVVCKIFRPVTLKQLEGKRRPQHICDPRMVAMALCRYFTKRPFVEIGKQFGGKDPSTVQHACKTIDDLAKNDPLRIKYDLCLELVKKKLPTSTEPEYYI